MTEGSLGSSGVLGVRRSGLTTALHELEKKGLIPGHRGAILILDRKGLKKQSNGSYASSEL